MGESTLSTWANKPFLALSILSLSVFFFFFCVCVSGNTIGTVFHQRYVSAFPAFTLIQNNLTGTTKDHSHHTSNPPWFIHHRSNVSPTLGIVVQNKHRSWTLGRTNNKETFKETVHEDVTAPGGPKHKLIKGTGLCEGCLNRPARVWNHIHIWPSAAACTS